MAELPRGMIRIMKRGGPPLEGPSPQIREVIINRMPAPTLVVDSVEPDPAPRGVLRISAAELSSEFGQEPILMRYPQSHSPPRRQLIRGRGTFGLAPRARSRGHLDRRAILNGNAPGFAAKMATNPSRATPPSFPGPGSATGSDSKPSTPVFGADFATQEIFKALEQAKPTTIPKPPIPDLTDEEKKDAAALRDFYLPQLRMLVKDAQLLKDFSMTRPVKLIDSYFFWCLKKGQQLEQLIAAVNPRNTNYAVVGVIGLQETGKSYILSQLVASSNDGPVFGSSLPGSARNDYTGKFKTEGVDCYISREHRTIFLDAQPVYSGSVLEEMIVGDRKPPAVSTEHVFVEHTVELQSVMFSAFLLSVCHKVIIVMKGCVDERVLRFLRAATILKLGPVHKDALNEANLSDHWPELVFINNMCRTQDLYPERVEMAKQKLESLMKDYPLRYNHNLVKKDFNGVCQHRALSPLDHIKLFSIPDTDAISRDEYLRAQFVAQLRLLKEEMVGSLPADSLTPGIPMTEKDWFRFSRRCWAAVCKAPLINTIAKELNVSNST